MEMMVWCHFYELGPDQRPLVQLEGRMGIVRNDLMQPAFFLSRRQRCEINNRQVDLQIRRKMLPMGFGVKCRAQGLMATDDARKRSLQTRFIGISAQMQGDGFVVAARGLRTELI